jgi:hypothetical protein
VSYQYKAYRDLTPEQKRRANCRSYAQAYLRRGKLTKKPCERCASEKVEMHHEDYSKPLEVVWLCRTCQRGTSPVARGPTLEREHPLSAEGCEQCKLMLRMPTGDLMPGLAG